MGSGTDSLAGRDQQIQRDSGLDGSFLTTRALQKCRGLTRQQGVHGIAEIPAGWEVPFDRAASKETKDCVGSWAAGILRSLPTNRPL